MARTIPDLSAVTKGDRSGQLLDSVVKYSVSAWIIMTAASISILQNNPHLQAPISGETMTNALTVGGVFALSAFVFFMANRGSESAEKKSVTNALTWVCTLPALTFGILIPSGLTITIRDFHGRPVFLANHLEPIVCTTMLVYIIGEITKVRQNATKTAFWNALVFIFGLLSVITREPYSTASAWFATMSYSIELVNMDTMYSSAIAGKTGATMNKNSMWVAKWIGFIGNTAGIYY